MARASEWESWCIGVNCRPKIDGFLGKRNRKRRENNTEGPRSRRE
jgi:hypothetical protein